MAFKTIKGLTVEIGGDTKNLDEALQGVIKKSTNLSKELSEVNRLLKMDPGNADLLAQKQKILSEAVENTAKKLETLKEAERQVQEQFERNEVSEEQVRALKREIEATTQKLEGYKNAAKETADEVANLGKESKASADDLNAIANGGAAMVGGLVTGAVTALTAAAESTREYRTEMGKLDTAFTENGHSSKAATDTYKALQGVLGETDQAVEASNHLAKLAKNEQDLSTWTDICTGVYATFGASLPIEGLTEAANETAKTGALTGSLADALNWAGVNEEDFQAKLDACNSEQERQALITETLNGLYSETANKYRETNAEVIAANEANEKWQASLAQVGAAVEPVLTSVKEMGAELLGKLVPVVEAMLANLPTVAVALGGIAAALVSYKVAALAATAAEQGMTLAQYAAAAAQRVLNAALLANPIGVVILAITALVAAFTYLWKNNEAFREFWIDLWEKIKAAALKAVDGLKALPGKVASAIQGALTRVQEWGSNMVSKAKTAMQNVVTSVTTTLKELPQKVLSIGKDLVTGLWNGVNNKLSWLKSKIKSFTSSVLSSIKSFFGVNSPSKETAWIGEMLDQGLAKGVEDAAGDPIKAMQRVSGSVLDAANGGVSFERSLARSGGTAAVAAAGAGNTAALLAKLDGIYARLGHLQIVLDTGTLVGEAIDKIDAGLANRQLLSARGV